MEKLSTTCPTCQRPDAVDYDYNEGTWGCAWCDDYGYIRDGIPKSINTIMYEKLEQQLAVKDARIAELEKNIEQLKGKILGTLFTANALTESLKDGCPDDLIGAYTNAIKDETK